MAIKNLVGGWLTVAFDHGTSEEEKFTLADRKLYLSWTTGCFFFELSFPPQAIYNSLQFLSASYWNHLGFSLLFILLMCMLLFPPDTKKFLVSTIAMLGLRAELIRLDEFNRQTSDGLMQKFSSFLYLVNIRVSRFSGRGTTLYFLSALVNSLCFDLNFS